MALEKGIAQRVEAFIDRDAPLFVIRILMTGERHMSPVQYWPERKKVA
ncbi:Uncharacterised protein [Salmonella enterica subsp. houtenae serovar Houten]|nr:hypothetical protein SEHO0A_04096 [Salmonella enterica subsp. houtenae str. ATCC BAA-1581]ENZ84653.1 hypothetical protein D088_530034 [Salmonella enterica subsp. houtenae serovar 16:z4,z32:-- str. RKS3027]SQI82841.1 Uncharacterised protein [Salmonella enterica subsp. houtenae serovar Houten]SUF53969.1 Uncharacterised protein [Salmonella enterica]VEA97017.1 Uncharacterised protein [Salmonella enterica subsp. houtenae]